MIQYFFLSQKISIHVLEELKTDAWLSDKKICLQGCVLNFLLELECTKRVGPRLRLALRDLGCKYARGKVVYENGCPVKVHHKNSIRLSNRLQVINQCYNNFVQVLIYNNMSV